MKTEMQVLVHPCKSLVKTYVQFPINVMGLNFYQLPETCRKDVQWEILYSESKECTVLKINTLNIFYNSKV